MADYSIPLALIVLLAYSLADTLGKKVVLRYGYAPASALVTGLSVVPFLVAWPFYASQQVGVYSAGLAAAAGIFYGVGFIFIYKSLATEQTTNTMALSEAFKATLVLAGVFLFSNILHAWQTIGIVAIFFGALLVMTTERISLNRKLLFAFVGFICWAVLWTMMGYSIGASKSFFFEGFIASASAFVVSCLASVLVYYRLPSPHRARMRRAVRSAHRGPGVWYAIMVGIAVGIGSLIFSYLILTKLLAVGSAIIALTPIVVAMASRRLYLDRLTTLQFIGLLVMVLGALALALWSYLPSFAL